MVGAQPDGLGNKSPDGGPMNSTLVPNSTNLQMAHLLAKIKAMEETMARPQVQQLDTRQLGTQFAKGISEALKTRGMKRSKSPDGAPEAPVTEFIKVEGQDDNHKTFCWPLRRAYKNPNAKPEDYWSEAQYPLVATPNLKGNLYLTHLMPLSVSGKALGWLHSAKQQMEIKYFTHSNRTNKRSKKEGLTISSGTDDMGATNYSVEETWSEANDLKDILDSLWNYTAACFQIRPWDWTPLVIGRVCHETGYFSGCSNSRAQQKSMTEEFINEVLFNTRTRLGQGSPPMTYHEVLAVAEATVGQANGRRGELLRGKGIYGGRWDLQQKEEEISRLKVQLAQARQDATTLRNSGRGRGGGDKGGYESTRGTRPGRGSRGRGGGRGSGGAGAYTRGSDPEFEAKRELLCLQFNRGNCSDPSVCHLVHTCSRRVGQGTPCGHNHSSQEHV